jgi:hypothetical protein
VEYLSLHAGGEHDSDPENVRWGFPADDVSTAPPVSAVGRPRRWASSCPDIASTDGCPEGGKLVRGAHTDALRAGRSTHGSSTPADLRPLYANSPGARGHTYEQPRWPRVQPEHRFIPRGSRAALARNPCHRTGIFGDGGSRLSPLDPANCRMYRKSAALDLGSWILPPWIQDPGSRPQDPRSKIQGAFSSIHSKKRWI